MVRQYPNGYYINGAWYRGRYVELPDSDVYDQDLRPINSGKILTVGNDTIVGWVLTDNFDNISHACKCHEHQIPSEPSYSRLLLIGIMMCVVALLAFMVGASL